MAPVKHLSPSGRWWAIVAVIAGFCAGCHTAVSDHATRAGGTLRVGTSGDYAPFSSAREPGRFEGFDIELARRFAAQYHLEVEFVRFRWPELLGDLASNRFDVAMSGVTVRPERSLAGQFTVPVAFSGAVAIVSPSSTARSVEALDRAGTRIGVNEGGYLEGVARRQFPNATIVVSTDNQTLPDRLARGECDAIVSDTVESRYWAARVKGARIIGPFTRDIKAWLLRKDEAELAAMLDRWLVARESDGTLDRLRRRYFGPAATARSADPLSALLAAMDERLALMPLVAESKRGTGRPVEDTAQESRVLGAAVEGVRKEARARGCSQPDENEVRAFFQAQIEVAKAIERRTLAGPAVASPEGGFDLDKQLRPALARIGQRISRLLVEMRASRRGSAHLPAEVGEQTRVALQGLGLSPTQLSVIADALVPLASRSPRAAD